MIFAGTRPEGVKLAPLVSGFNEGGRLGTWLVDTGQQPGRVAEALVPFGFKPDVEVSVDAPPAFVSRGGTKLANALDELGLIAVPHTHGSGPAARPVT